MRYIFLPCTEDKAAYLAWLRRTYAIRALRCRRTFDGWKISFEAREAAQEAE